MIEMLLEAKHVLEFQRSEKQKLLARLSVKARKTTWLSSVMVSFFEGS